MGSTLVAHPIDTLKTMQQAGVGSVDPDEGKGGVSKDYKHKDDDGRVRALLLPRAVRVRHDT